ncbi:MAG: precorrin-8X methylmutase [Actinomycetota bacterium]
MTEIHPIEVESYRILATRVDLGHHSPIDRSIIERMIHATADLSFADSARIGAAAGEALVAAVAAGAPVIVDAAMVAAGITRHRTHCYLPEVPVAPEGTTRSAEAFRLAAQEHPTGAVFVCGNAPTALFELLRLHDAGLVDPAAVVGLPVGFVGAKESKAALWASPLADISVTNDGERGGSPAAAGAFNAAVRHAAARSEPSP